MVADEIAGRLWPGRRVELEGAAAEIGVGAEVVDFVRPEGCLITRLIEGRPAALPVFA